MFTMKQMFTNCHNFFIYQPNVIISTVLKRAQREISIAVEIIAFCNLNQTLQSLVNGFTICIEMHSKRVSPNQLTAIFFFVVTLIHIISTALNCTRRALSRTVETTEFRVQTKKLLHLVNFLVSQPVFTDNTCFTTGFYGYYIPAESSWRITSATWRTQHNAQFCYDSDRILDY